MFSQIVPRYFICWFCSEFGSFLFVDLFEHTSSCYCVAFLQLNFPIPFTFDAIFISFFLFFQWLILDFCWLSISLRILDSISFWIRFFRDSLVYMDICSCIYFVLFVISVMCSLHEPLIRYVRVAHAPECRERFPRHWRFPHHWNR